MDDLKEEMMKILNMMNERSEKTLDRIEKKIDKITNDVIPAMREKIDQNGLKIDDIEEEVNVMKKKTEVNEEDIDEIKEKIKENEERMNKMESNERIAELKIADIVNVIDEGNSRGEDDEKMKKIEERIEAVEKVMNQKGEKEKSYKQAMINEGKMKEKDTTDDKVIKDKENEKEGDYEIDDARNRIGIFPITQEHIARYARKSYDLYNVSNHELFTDNKYKDERKKAAALLFANELHFREDEIEILETKMANDPYSKVMWVTTRESNVKKIYRRAAQVRNPEVKLLTFFPQKLYRKKMLLEEVLKKARNNEPKLKTQIRLGRTDIELWTKFKSEPYWAITPLTEYGPIESVSTFPPPGPRDVTTPPKQTDNVEQTNDNNSNKRKNSSPLSQTKTSCNMKKTRPTADEWFENGDILKEYY